MVGRSFPGDVSKALIICLVPLEGAREFQSNRYQVIEDAMLIHVILFWPVVLGLSPALLLSVAVGQSSLPHHGGLLCGVPDAQTCSAGRTRLSNASDYLSSTTARWVKESRCSPSVSRPSVPR